MGARSPYKIALSCWAGATKMQPVLEILFPSLPELLARPIEVHDTLHIPVGLGPNTIAVAHPRSGLIDPCMLVRQA